MNGLSERNELVVRSRIGDLMVLKYKFIHHSLFCYLGDVLDGFTVISGISCGWSKFRELSPFMVPLLFRLCLTQECRKSTPLDN